MEEQLPSKQEVRGSSPRRGTNTGRGIGPHTIHAYINQFVGWAAGEGEAVTAKAQLPRLPKKLIDVLTRDEVQALENAAQTDRATDLSEEK